MELPFRRGAGGGDNSGAWAFAAETSFMKKPVIGILRGFSTGQLAKIVEATLVGGLEYLEVTMNSAGADEQIREASGMVGERMKIGAGTVLSLAQLERALAV